MGLIKDLNILVPVVRDKCIQLEAECKRMGIYIGWAETRRLRITQKAYFAQGRELLLTVNAKRKAAGLWPLIEEENKRKVTNAMESIHFFDCAGDFFLIIDGKPSWNTKADINDDDIFDYENVGHIAEMLGMVWGGRFPFKDYAHVQFTGGLSIQQLRDGERPQGDVYW